MGVAGVCVGLEHEPPVPLQSRLLRCGRRPQQVGPGRCRPHTGLVFDEPELTRGLTPRKTHDPSGPITKSNAQLHYADAARPTWLRRGAVVASTAGDLPRRCQPTERRWWC